MKKRIALLMVLVMAFCYIGGGYSESDVIEGQEESIWPEATQEDLDTWIWPDEMPEEQEEPTVPEPAPEELQESEEDMAALGASEFRAEGVDYTINDPNNADEFSASVAYSAGQYVYYQGILYRFTADHAAGAWNSAHVTQAKLGQDVSDLKSALSVTDGTSRAMTGALHVEWENGGINYKNGEEQNGSAYLKARARSKNYIPVTPGYTIDANNLSSGISTAGSQFIYYDANKVFLGQSTSTTIGKHTIPENAAYLRINCTLSNNDGDLNAVVNVAFYIYDDSAVFQKIAAEKTDILATVDNDFDKLETKLDINYRTDSDLTGAIFPKWENGSIKGSTGEDQDGQAYMLGSGRTGFIEVSPGETLYQMGNVGSWYWFGYKTDKSYVNIYAPAQELVIPSNVAYIRITCGLPVLDGDLSQLEGFTLYRKNSIIMNQIAENYDDLDDRLDSIEYSKIIQMKYRGWPSGLIEITPLVPNESYTYEYGSSAHAMIIQSELIPAVDYFTIKGHVNVANVGGAGRPNYNIVPEIYNANQEFEGYGTAVNFTNDTDFDVSFDLNYSAVYENASYVRIAIVAHGNNGVNVESATIVLSDYARVSAYSDLATYAPTVPEWLRNLNDAVSLSQTTDTTYLTSPAGERFIQMLNSNNQIVMVPVIPTKALFIGNSLLLGFSTYGMCASEPQYDYFNRIYNVIHGINSSFTATKIVGSPLEGKTTLASAKSWIDTTIIPLIGNDTDLVMIQLGDNVNTDEKRAVFNDSSLYLLQQVRTHAPNARVVWFGSWYAQSLMPTIAVNARKTGSEFYSITDIKSDNTTGSIGLVYYSEAEESTTYTIDSYTENGDNTLTVLFTVDGTQYTTTIPYTSYTVVSATSITITGHYKFVYESGVASHPGNEGFRQIANRLLYKMGIVDVPEYYAAGE